MINYGVRNSLRSTAERRERLRVQAGADSAIDWAGVLIMQALHDCYGFGRGRFAKMDCRFEKLESGDVWKYLKHIQDNGFDWEKAKKIGITIQKLITGNTQNNALKQHTRDMIVGVIVVSVYELYDTYGFRKKRISDLLDKLCDYTYLLKHRQVQIWEFMKCMSTTCDIDFPVLDAYEKKNGAVDIGPAKAIYL